jgi:hypothetical protein
VDVNGRFGVRGSAFGVYGNACEETVMRRRAWVAATGGVACGALAVLALDCGLRTGGCGLPSPAFAADQVRPDEGDNAACLCCHMDFDGEEICEKHLAQKITCRSCHGPSEPHRQDETLMTKPDLIHGRAEVVTFCRQCHPSHKKPEAVTAFLAQWVGKTRPDNKRFIREDAVCTDCHGEHTIPKKR